MKSEISLVNFTILCMFELWLDEWLFFFFPISVDVWSVGCIFAELLSRNILFQAQSPVQQVGGSWLLLYFDCIIRLPADVLSCIVLLPNFMTGVWCIFPSFQLNLIIDLLGTPSLDDLCRAGASEGATKYILQKGHKAVSYTKLTNLNWFLQYSFSKVSNEKIPIVLRLNSNMLFSVIFCSSLP